MKQPEPTRDITIPVEIEEIVTEQTKDEYIQKLWQIASAKGEVNWKINRLEWNDAQNIRKLAGVIVKDVRRITGELRARVIVPKNLQRRIVEKTHRASHAGINGTYHALQRDHWFRGMKRAVKDELDTVPTVLL